MEGPLRVAVDYRERRGALLPVLEGRPDMDVRVTSLEAGDYVVEDRITVERKTIADLLLALRDGRLLRQAASLKRNAERPLLLLEGVGLRDVNRAIEPAVRGAIASLSAMWYLPVLWAATPAETADLFVLIGRLWHRDRRETWQPPPRKTPRFADPRLGLLRCLPGVGRGIARGLLDRFGSVRAICDASPDDLRAVKGIGTRRAKSIRRFLGESTAGTRESR